MADLEYRPVGHDHDAFLKKALKRKGFSEAYADLEDEYALIRELLAARSRAGLTQEEVAESMGTTKSAVSRLEAAGKHSPSVTTLKKYAHAVGCEVEIRLVPAPRPTRASSRQPLRGCS
jgi:transcriptional regulator with XRE-family HTH domain